MLSTTPHGFLNRRPAGEYLVALIRLCAQIPGVADGQADQAGQQNVDLILIMSVSPRGVTYKNIERKITCFLLEHHHVFGEI